MNPFPISDDDAPFAMRDARDALVRLTFAAAFACYIDRVGFPHRLHDARARGVDTEDDPRIGALGVL